MTVIINGTAGITFPDGTTQTDGLVTPVPAADGGTGLSSPGTAGNVLTSNGTAWVSAIGGGGLTNNTRQAITSSSTTTIDVDDGNVVDLTMADNITTLAFSNVPASGTPLQLVIVFRNAADAVYYNVTWPSSIYWNTTDGAPGSVIGPTLAFGANTITVISLLTTDGGTKWRGWVEASIPGQLAGNNLYLWGLNGAGQLGINDIFNRSSPTQVGLDTAWAQMKTSSFGNCMLGVKTNGTLWGWGQNNDGQLGQNDTIYRSSPTQIGSDTNWASVSTGNYNTVAIKTTGSIWSWGRNTDGQLGLGNIINRSSPVQIGSDTNWASVSAGSTHSLAIKTTGSIWSWGRNLDGQLGQNNIINRSSPVQIGSDTNWASVSGGVGWTIAIRTTGSLWAWGGNTQGQLGQNNTTNRSAPIQIGSNTNWSKISAGVRQASAITTSNTMFTWGSNLYGCLGLNDEITKSSPVQVGSDTNWSDVRVTSYFGIAIKTTGSIWSWGDNSDGQLGQNNSTIITNRRSSPVQIGLLTSWTQIAMSPSVGTALQTAPAINPA
jgi:alpha-tubulin suppressor-like RCC1 family protein